MSTDQVSPHIQRTADTQPPSMYLPLAAADSHHQPSILCLVVAGEIRKVSGAEADQMRLCDGNQQHPIQMSCNGGPPAQYLHENKRNPGNFGAMREWNRYTARRGGTKKRSRPAKQCENRRKCENPKQGIRFPSGPTIKDAVPSALCHNPKKRWKENTPG